MHGRGVYTFATGAIYDGEFQANAFHGVGSYRWADGAHYEGGWHFNKYGRQLQLIGPIMGLGFICGTCLWYCFAVRMHGEGLYVDKEGVRWQGRFLNGKYHNGRIFHTLR